MTGTAEEVARIQRDTVKQATANCIPIFNPKNGTVGDFLYGVHISLRFKYIYFEVPKAACSTIKLRLIQNELGTPIHYGDMVQVHMRQVSPLLNPIQILDFKTFANRTEVFKFAFTRHPVSRLLSAYRDKVSSPSNVSHRIYEELGKPETSGVISFDEFVDYVVQREPKELDRHWRPQANLLNLPENKIDFIGRFENFEKDFAIVAKNCKLDEKLTQASIKQHETNSRIFKDNEIRKETLCKIMAYYKLDIEMFEYE